MRPLHTIFSTMIFLRMNSFLLRAAAFATTPPTNPSTKSMGMSSSRLLSSLSEKAESSKVSAETYTSITGPDVVTKFGNLSFSDIPDSIQRVVFVLGGPGSGKGTQSDLILQNYPCVHLSAGQLLRDETSKEGSPHAQMIEDCLVAGKIVPVEISLALLAQAMVDAPGKSMVFLVDGFPRNFDNLDGWTLQMPSVSSVSGVLHYDCPLEVLEKRILERAKKSGRSDDNLESLRKRFKTFDSDTMPVVKMLNKVSESSSMEVFEIEANRPIESVWEDTQTAMNQVILNDILANNHKLLISISSENVEDYAQLCGEEFIGEEDEPKDIMNAKELGMSESYESENSISNTKVEFVSGTKVKVSYNRQISKAMFKETRTWTHTRNGWKMVDFARSPLKEEKI